jgi:predicted metal-dependent hydrolase
VDLFNMGYWWECHEVLEALWNAAGRKTPQASFVQGLLQVAAAELNRRRGKRAVSGQAERGLRRMEAVSRAAYMGLDVRSFARDVRTAMNEPGLRVRIELEDER